MVFTQPSAVLHYPGLSDDPMSCYDYRQTDEPEAKRRALVSAKEWQRIADARSDELAERDLLGGGGT